MKKFDEAYWAKLAETEKAKSLAQVVGKVNGKAVTRGELEVAFNMVVNKANWKMPINAVVELNAVSKAMVAEAVVFFTGSKAEFEPVSGENFGGTKFRVKAAGYYRAIGA